MSSEATGDADPLADGPRRRCALVLVVDDDPLQRLRARDALEEAGFEVAEAETGDAGLAAAAALRPDLILLDVMMPGLDGFTVCRTIRALPTIAVTPILVTTNLDDLASIEAAFEAGATDFVTKPINWPLLGYRARFALRVKEMDDDLRIARDRAQAASRAKAAFLASMSHELRTPLNAIIGFAELLGAQVQGPMDRAYIEYAAHIETSGRRLLDIVNTVLEFAEAEGGREPVTPEPCDPEAAIRTAFADMQEAALAGGVTLGYEISPQTGLVFADRRALRRVLRHLVSNGIKFNRRGGTVTVRIGRDDIGQSVIAVEDDGIGIPASRLESVIEPFRQGEEGLGRSHDGTGLGLAVVDALIGLHGGRMKLSSVEGTGTTVVVTLPPSPPRAAGAAAAM